MEGTQITSFNFHNPVSLVLILVPFRLRSQPWENQRSPGEEIVHVGGSNKSEVYLTPNIFFKTLHNDDSHY